MWWMAVIGAFWLLMSGDVSLAQSRSCSNGAGCGSGLQCAADGKTCIPEGYVECATGSLCPAGKKCSADGKRCLPKEMVDCGTYSCGPGKTCGADNKCVAKNAPPVQRPTTPDTRQKDARNVRRAPARPQQTPEDERSHIAFREFIEAKTGAAQTESPSLHPVAAMQSIGPEIRPDPAPVVEPPKPPAKMIEEERDATPTAAAITQLQAEIRKAEENRRSLEQEITKLQAKMQALSLKKWQEQANQYKEDSSGGPLAFTSASGNMKLSCRIVDATIGNANKIRLDCERQLATNDAPPSAPK